MSSKGGEGLGWNEERKDRDRKGRIVEDGGTEALRGEERQPVRRSRKRMARLWVEGRRAAWGFVAVEVESLWTAACFPSP